MGKPSSRSSTKRKTTASTNDSAHSVTFSSNVRGGTENGDGDDDLNDDPESTTSSSSTNIPGGPASSRRERQKEVAERRAAFFARADSAVSTTPTGSFRPAAKKKNTKAPPSGKGKRSKDGRGCSEATDEDDEDDNDEEEAWPGPFTTARTIMNKREAARKAREEAIANKEMDASNTEPSEGWDEYDQATACLRWFPAAGGDAGIRLMRERNGPIKSLAAMCVNLLAEHFDFVEDLHVLSGEARGMIAAELARRRQLDSAALTKLSVKDARSECVVLPECSCIEEDALLAAIESASGCVVMPADLAPEEESEQQKQQQQVPVAKKRRANAKTKTTTTTESTSLSSASLSSILTGNTHTTATAITAGAATAGGGKEPMESSLRVLSLRNCGRCFTDKTAAASVHHVRSLEVLEAAGCYRLSDAALCKVLEACRGSLRELDIGCDSRLGAEGLSCIARKMCTLESLTLDHCTQLTDTDLLYLCGKAAAADDSTPSNSGSSSRRELLPCLKKLSLAGLFSLSDQSIVQIIATFGRGLQSLSLAGCVQLTDVTLVELRNECRALQELDLSQLGALSTAALVALFIAAPLQGSSSSLPEEGDVGVGIGLDREYLDQQSSASGLKQGHDAPAGDSGSRVEGKAGDSIGLYLQAIRLNGVRAVTDDVVVALSLLGRRVLHTVEMSGCSLLTNRSLVALQMNCGQTLRCVDISFVRGMVSEDCVGWFVDACALLERLNVWGCTQLTRRFFDGHGKNDLSVVGRMCA